MTWHAALVTLEQAVIWSTAGGAVGWLFLRHPIRKLLAMLLLHAVEAARLTDKLDTKTDGGLRDVLDALQQSGPPPRTSK